MTKRKTLLREATIADAVSDAMSEIQCLRDEIAEWADNMESHNMEHLSKYEEVSEARDALEEVADDEPDVPELPDGFSDQLSWSTFRKRRPSRADRAGDASMTLEAVAEHIEKQIGDREGDWTEEWQELADRCREIAEAVGNVSFPGMY